MPPRHRSAQEVIDAAIRDNRPNEYLLYVFSALFVLLGTIAFGYALSQRDPTFAIGGAIESGLFYPAMRLVHRIRHENQKIRLLEIPLGNAQTANDAAMALREVFSDEFQRTEIVNARPKGIGV